MYGGVIVQRRSLDSCVTDESAYVAGCGRLWQVTLRLIGVLWQVLQVLQVFSTFVNARAHAHAADCSRNLPHLQQAPQYIEQPATNLQPTCHRCGNAPCAIRCMLGAVPNVTEADE